MNEYLFSCRWRNIFGAEVVRIPLGWEWKRDFSSPFLLFVSCVFTFCRCRWKENREQSPCAAVCFFNLFFRIEKTFRMEIIFVGVQCIDHVKNGNEWVVDWGSTPSTWTTLWSSCSMIYHSATVDWIRTSDALIASVGHWEASIDEQIKKKHKKQSCSSNIICSNILVTYFEWTAHP